MIHCRNKIDYFPYIYYGFILIIFNNKKYKIIKIYKIFINTYKFIKINFIFYIDKNFFFYK